MRAFPVSLIPIIITLACHGQKDLAPESHTEAGEHKALVTVMIIISSLCCSIAAKGCQREPMHAQRRQHHISMLMWLRSLSQRACPLSSTFGSCCIASLPSTSLPHTLEITQPMKPPKAACQGPLAHHSYRNPPNPRNSSQALTSQH